MALGDRGAVANFDALPARADARRRRQAYERVAAEALAADDRFQEKGVRPVGELDVERKRRVEIGERLEDKRDAVKSLRGKRAEFGFGHDASTVIDVRNGLRKRRLRRATRALAYEWRQQRQRSPRVGEERTGLLPSRALKLMEVKGLEPV